jgi:uncharacterized protein involved in oxidation of intracellular sulfur
MKLGIVIYSDDSETVWNAFRLGNLALKEGDEVKIFLFSKGVECESLDSRDFKITEKMNVFSSEGGEILACGTCLGMRNSQGTELCPASTMKDLHEIIKGSDKVVTF